MKLLKVVLVSTIAVVLTSVTVPSWAAASGGVSINAASATPLLGRWDLTLKSPDHEYPSWIEITNKSGQLKAQMVGRWGNARPLPKVEVTGDGKLTFVSPKEEEGASTDLVFEGHLSGKTLSGTVNGPDGKTWQWAGVRAPALKGTSTPKWGESIQLFNGRDLTGWKTSQAGPPDWTVQNGAIVTPGHGPELVSDRKFQDFKLHVEFNCDKDSNSGVYVRGRYEVQVETDSVEEPPSHHTGGVYGFLAPSPEQPRSPDTWQTFDITLIGRYVTVVLNGKTVIDNKEIPGITGGAVDSQEAMPGPIYLQGSEKGHVKYRSIVITPAK